MIVEAVCANDSVKARSRHASPVGSLQVHQLSMRDLPLAVLQMFPDIACADFEDTMTDERFYSVVHPCGRPSRGLHTSLLEVFDSGWILRSGRLRGKRTKEPGRPAPKNQWASG